VADFEQDTAVHPRADGAFDCEIAGDWWVVAGPNGGYLAAIVARALEAAADGASRPLRSLTVHFLRAPEVGRARVEVVVERRGRTVTFAGAHLIQDERPCARAIAVLADVRTGYELEHAAPPAVPAPEEIAAAADRPDAPPVARQLDFRPALTGRGERALTGGWMRLRRDAALDTALLVALCDFWLPAVFSVTPEPIGVPTLELTVHVRARPALERDWVLGRFATRTARHGLLEEDGELWSRSGVLLAQSRQLALSLPGGPPQGASGS
jgi:acyl-CoA thioesterase